MNINSLIKKFWTPKETDPELFYPNPNFSLSFDDVDFKLMLDIKMNRKNDLYVFIELFDTNNKYLINRLNDDESRRLLALIHSHISNIINRKGKKTALVFDIKTLSFFIRSISISQLKLFMQFCSKITKLKSISVYSIYKFHNEQHIIAKTLIELDADILTIISDEIFDIPNAIQLIKIHMHGTILANHIFFSPLKKISYFVSSLRRLIPFIASAYWVFFIHALSIHLLNGSLSVGIAWSIFNYVFMPSLTFLSSRYAIKLIIRKVFS